jgi:hypothetical protein
MFFLGCCYPVLFCPLLAQAAYNILNVRDPCCRLMFALCAGLWDDASFKVTGNLFFPDFWSTPADSQEQGVAYDLVGLEHKEAQVGLGTTCLEGLRQQLQQRRYSLY